MAYLDCPSCGQRATGKATRCPQCGLIFTPGIRQQSITRPGLRKLRRALVVAGAMVSLAAAVVVFKGRDLSSAFTVSPVTTGLEPQPILDDTASRPPAQEEQTGAAPPPPPPSPSLPTPTRPDPTPTPPPPRDTAPSLDAALAIKPPSDTAPPVPVGDSAPSAAEPLPLDTTPAIDSLPDSPTRVGVDDSAPSVLPGPPAAQLQRYARTWVNIREGPSDSTPAVRTLAPGEAVLVDSLSQGWYRVVVDGRTEGYVDGAYLDAVPADGP